MLHELKALVSRDRGMILSLKNILGFYPKNIALYKLAFKHKSAATVVKEGVKASNERLEYLGDAVLGAVVAHYLFKKFPFKGEGFLTEMRSKIVSRVYLNRLAIRIGVDHFLETSSSLQKNKSANGDALEALIGAIYLDQGYSGTKKFILNKLIGNHVDIHELQNVESNFKSRLIEWAQKEKKALRFETVQDASPENENLYFIHLLIDNEIVGKGKEFSKKKAEQNAAQEAFELIFKKDTA